MTSFTSLKIRCHCDTIFETYFPASINSILNPKMIEELLHGDYSKVTCPNCDYKIPITGTMVIGSPAGVLCVPLESLEKIREILFKHKVIDDEGIVIDTLHKRQEKLQENKKIE